MTYECESKRDKPKTFQKCNGWGNAIHFEAKTDKTLSVYGHQSDRPRRGDLLQVDMQSGKMALYEFTKVKYCYDPRDMFFADAKFKEYAP